MITLKELKAVRIDRRSGYSFSDILITIRLMGKRPIGRFSVMSELGLGEATAKTMIKKMEKEGIAKKTARGHVLAAKGMEIFMLLEKRVSDPVSVRVPAISEKPSVAFVVRGAGKRIRKGIEQRDEGIKNGVDVTTLVFDGGRIRFPGVRNMVEIAELRDALEDGDVIIVSSGKNLNEANRGGFAVAMTLI